jgi:hypothetical protein
VGGAAGGVVLVYSAAEEGADYVEILCISPPAGLPKTDSNTPYLRNGQNQMKFEFFSR